MSNKVQKVPEKPEEVLYFWQLMIRVLKRMDPRKIIEFWEFDSVVENAVSLDMNRGWDPEKTYEILPKLVCYLCRTSMDTNDMMFLHMRLRIQLEQYDKEQLEKKRDLIIETDRKGYVIKWSRKVEKGGKEAEKKDGNSMEKSKIDSVDEQKTNCDDKKTVTGGEKNMEREKKTTESMVKREPFTHEEEVSMLNFVYSKIEHELKYDLKPSKMATDKAWIELTRRPGMTKTAKSYESHYRKQMKVRLFSIQDVDAEQLLAIGKAHEVSMSERIKRAYEEHNGMSIELDSGGKIVDWCKNTTY